MEVGVSLDSIKYTIVSSTIGVRRYLRVELKSGELMLTGIKYDLIEVVTVCQQSLNSGQDIKRQRLGLPAGILGRGSRMSNESHKGRKAQVIH